MSGSEIREAAEVLCTMCTKAEKFSCLLLMSSPVSMGPSVSLEDTEETLT